MKNLNLIFYYVQPKLPINKAIIDSLNTRCIECILYTVLYFILLYIVL